MEIKTSYIRTYVLRSGKISSAQKRCYEELFPLYGIRGNVQLNFAELFGNNNPLVAEIGFGMGRATAEIALRNPDINYLGIEVHKPGIGRLLWDIEKNNIKNIRIAEADAKEFIASSTQDESVSAFHIFFPDPWQKKRHHKRRLMMRPFTDLLSSKLVKDGYIYMVTDWEDYGDFALSELGETPGLENRYDGFAERQSWRPITEFENKGLKKNHEIRELYFTRKMQTEIFVK